MASMALLGEIFCLRRFTFHSLLLLMSSPTLEAVALGVGVALDPDPSQISSVISICCPVPTIHLPEDLRKSLP